jgi:sugar phosphate isomerase/epimerase
MSLRFGYGTNGFQSHRLDDALTVIADLGYDGVALTIDHMHHDPFAPDVVVRTRRLRRQLDRLGLAVVIETGARYLLDPWRKHHPTLVSAGDRSPRTDLLNRAVDIGAELGAEAVSFWSGTLPESDPVDVGWARLSHGVEDLVTYAQQREVTLAMEPEPGMLVSTVDDVFELRHRLGEPDPLRITLDLGHIVCNEPRDVAATVAAAGPLLANVQVDDMVRDVHEHLELGQGDVDFPAALSALAAVGYRGLACLELPRQGHAAPMLARSSLAYLRAAQTRATESGVTGEERFG